MLNEYVNIVMITDEKYAMPTSVALTSILLNKEKNVNYSIFLICDRLSIHSKEKFANLLSNNFQINFIDVSSEKYKILEKSYSKVSSSSLLKFEIPNLLPQINKVLYLDGDVIVTKSLLHLFNTDISNKYAAVVRDGPKEFIVGGKKHWFYGEKNYFNSGMMLMNLDIMRKNDISKKLLEYRLNEYNYFMDQDAFNMVFAGKVRFVGVENDFLLHLISYQNKNLSIQQLNNFYETRGYQNLDELFNEVVIFHYTFGKPWRYYDVPFNEIWMNYFKKSPFFSKELNRISIMTDMYNKKSYRVGRIISKIFRTIFFFINFNK